MSRNFLSHAAITPHRAPRRIAPCCTWGFLLLGLVLLGSPAPVQATIYYYDTTTTAGLGVGGANDWTTTNIWNTSSSGAAGSNLTWTDGNTGVFNGNGTVGLTVDNAVAANVTGGSGYAVGIGVAPASGSTVTVNFSGSSTLTLSGGYLGVGWQTAGGSSTATVLFNQSSGTIDVLGGVEIGRFGTNATYNLSGGTVNSAGILRVGNNSSGTANPVGAFNITGGTFSGATALIGNAANTRTATATVTVSGTGQFLASFVTLGGTLGSATSTINLNSGGTIKFNSVTQGVSVGGTNSGTFNFNGGELYARQDTTGFMSGLTRANVRNGGALINTDGYDVTIAQALLHSNIGGDAATDGGLTKSGAGTLTLTGNNAYTGATSINTGVLNIQHANALGTTANGTTVASGAALEIEGGITTAAEALTLNGAGISSGGALRNVSGDNSYAGLVTLGSAARINSDSGTLTLSNAGTITGSGNALTVGGAGNVTINSILGTGAGTLTKVGAGTLILKGANTYSGGTTVSAGTLQIGDNSAGTLSTGAASVAAGAELRFYTTSYIGGSTYNGNLSGAGDVIIDGLAGTHLMRFAGNNSGFTGTFTVLSGSRASLHSANAGSTSARFVIDGNLGGQAANGSTYHLGELSGGGQVGGGGITTVVHFSIGALNTNSTFSGTLLAAVNNVTKVGSGTLTLSGISHHVGSTTINAGTLSVSNVADNGTSSHLGAGSSLVFGGGTLAFTAAGPDSTNRVVTINGGGAGFNITNSAGNLSMTGAFSGAGALTKTGLGTLTLTSANSYGGGTTISGGTLAVNNTSGSATGGGGVTIGANGRLAGAGSISGLVTTSANTAGLAPGNSPGTLSLLGGLNAAAGATFYFELGTVSDLIDLGASTFTGSSAANGLRFHFSDSGGITTGVTYTLLTFGSAAGLDYTDLIALSRPLGVTLDANFGVGGWQINSNSLQVQFMVVPEPSTALLLSLGAAALALGALRRRQKTA